MKLDSSMIFCPIGKQAYIDFEISEGEFLRTRELYERLLDRTKHLKVWISYAKFEASAMDDSDSSDSEQWEKEQCIERMRSEYPNTAFSLSY